MIREWDPTNELNVLQQIIEISKGSELGRAILHLAPLNLASGLFTVCNRLPNWPKDSLQLGKANLALLGEQIGWWKQPVLLPVLYVFTLSAVTCLTTAAGVRGPWMQSEMSVAV